jgi:tRNA(adenine34) deaminase
VYFGAPDPKGGGVLQGPKIFTQPTCHHHLETLEGPLDLCQSPQLLRDFFKKKRK